MHFRATKLSGTFEIQLEPQRDERGFFARTWCRREFAERGLKAEIAQSNLSSNDHRGTLRGLHYQEAPYGEAKLVQCIRGSIYDVVVDLRPGSCTYCDWIAVFLTAEKHNMLYVPEGCAHGFLTMEEQSEVFYQMSQFYNPEASRGVRWNDPAFRITWPADVRVISERDRTYPDFQR